ncbi:hypothetical protein D806_016060 [Mycolicibacterium smegmatis MKD8]|uniref:Uncharacterized protein n=1 Tax=Mycolicibacterium smegmatis (strain MKD8) TaxID=1214915 RepID=A0A2U9PLG9_MYCSE|nr:hypothetical protein D806_016060 [Mycolicibacterium smegmatis MKD8]
MLTDPKCPRGHEIRSSADRTISGYCRNCKRDDDRRDRIAKRAALDVVRVFEAAGVRFQDNGQPVAAEEVARQLVSVYGDEHGPTR